MLFGDHHPMTMRKVFAGQLMNVGKIDELAVLHIIIFGIWKWGTNLK